MSQTESAPTNRFVVLYHELTESQAALWPLAEIGLRRETHWDLMLEWENRLLTWALDAEPFREDTASAIQLPSHRTEFLTFEGPLSNNRGTVSRVFSGTYRMPDLPPQTNSSLTQLISRRSFYLNFFCVEFCGQTVFNKVSDDRWILLFHRSSST